MIGSFTTLLIVLGFVLPGYITRSIVGLRVYLRPIGDFELLFQSVWLSTFYVVLGTIVTVIPSIHWLSPLYMISPMDKIPPALGWNALASLGVLLVVSVLIGRWSWLVAWVTTYGRRLHPYPIWYNLFGAPLTTEGSPWVRVEMDNGKVITGRVMAFGLDDHDAGRLC